MESTGESGRIQVSAQVYERTKHLFTYRKWDEHEVKGRVCPLISVICFFLFKLNFTF
jgi:hypothetical protein